MISRFVLYFQDLLHRVCLDLGGLIVVLNRRALFGDFVEDAHLLRLCLALLRILANRCHALSVLLQVTKLGDYSLLLLRGAICRQVAREVQRELVFNLHGRISRLRKLVFGTVGLLIPLLCLDDGFDYLQVGDALHVLQGIDGMELVYAVCLAVFHLFLKNLSPSQWLRPRVVANLRGSLQL